MEKGNCSVCGTLNVSKQADYDLDSVFFNCPICGRYELFLDSADYKKLDRNLLSFFLFYNSFKKGKNGKIEYRYYTTLPKEKCDEYVKEFKSGNNKNGHPVHMDMEEVDNWYPDKFSEKVDYILLNLEQKIEHIGQEIILNREEFYSCMFVDRYDLNGNNWIRRSERDIDKQGFYMLSYLIEMGYINGIALFNGDKLAPITLTPKGYARVDELQKKNLNGRHVLVAMKFGQDTLKLREAIRSGITEAGYQAIFIDEVEHNDFITPELLKHIQNSKFVVVDLSHQNNGAYFEEGYAMGLGKPVIQLCKKNVNLHFDIAQKNTIIWENEEEISLRLKNRIIATID